jgi:hypothetical protein
MLTSRLPKLTAVIEAPEGRFVKEMDLRLEDYAISYVTSIVLHQRARLVTWTIHDESGRERVRGEHRDNLFAGDNFNVVIPLQINAVEFTP